MDSVRPDGQNLWAGKHVVLVRVLGRRLAVLAVLAASAMGSGAAGKPTISFSTFFGGNNFTGATGVALDGAGNFYVTGWTGATNLPVKGAAQSNFGGGVDAFVAKFDPTGSTLLYCTYLGGAGDDRSYGIAVDGAGSAYVTGWTYSTDFPTAGTPAQAALSGGRDAFIAKLSPAGDRLIYSTFLGGPGNDAGRGVALGSNGSAYVTGETSATSFPLLHPLQNSLKGGQNAFVAGLDSTGKLLFSTYLGGSGTDGGAAVAVDGSGSLYVTGSTTSTDFPTVNAFQGANGGYQDAFITKVGPNGAFLAYSTYLGGSGGAAGYPETGLGIDVDANGSAYVTGVTSSSNFPVHNGFQTTLNGWLNAFVVKLSAAGNTLVFGTYLGGSSLSTGNAIRIDGTGAGCVAGGTTATDFPVVNAVQTANAGPAGSYDAFLSCFTTGGNALSFSTLLGGTSSDTGYGVALDATSFYMVGQSASSNFPLANAMQAQNPSGQSAFVTKFTATPAPPPAPALSSPADGASGVSVSAVLSWSASSGATSYNVYLGASSSPSLVTNSTGVTYSTAALAAGTTYYWQAAAVNANGSTASPIWSFTTQIACTYTIIPTTATPAAAGGTGTLTVTAPAGCGWTAAGNTNWLTVTAGNSGSGGGTVTYTVTANSSTSSRTGTLTVAGQTFTVNQNGVGCTYTVSPTSAPWSASGGTGTVTVTAPVGCGWTAASNASWLAVTAGSSGSGNGTVSYTVAANAASGAQVGTLTIAGQTFTVNQNGVGCTYSVSPTSAPWSASGGTGTVTVTAPAGCSWTTTSNTSWITIASGGSGSGNGAVRYAVAANSSSMRSGSPAVAGQTFSITQAAAGNRSAPAIKALSPFTGTGLSQTFTVAYSSINGWANLSLAYFMANVVQSPSNSCYVEYNVAANTLRLIGDDAVTWQGPITPGSGSLSNGACTLNGTQSSVSAAGADLTVNYGITFQSSYAGRRALFLSAQDSQGMTLDWSPYGAWWPTISSGSLTNWYRLYDPFTSSHHFTTDLNEYNMLMARGFTGEGAIGQAYNAPNGSAQPFYRIYIMPAQTHFWTTDRNEYLTLILNRGYYSGEGIDPFLLATSAGGAIPDYRLLYCCATPPNHFWTTDANEHTTLQQRGWSSEGIVGYLSPVAAKKSGAETPMLRVVNSGSYEEGDVAGGQRIRVFGRGMAGAKVTIDGVEAKMVGQTEREAEVVVPEEVGGRGKVTIQVEHGNGEIESREAGVALANPAVFARDQYGKGQAMARLADGRMNSERNRVGGGEELTLYATGLGKGLPVSVTIGGKAAELVEVSESEGRSELRVRVPEDLDSGAATVVLRAGEFSSQAGVTLAVK